MFSSVPSPFCRVCMEFRNSVSASVSVASVFKPSLRFAKKGKNTLLIANVLDKIRYESNVHPVFISNRLDFH